MSVARFQTSASVKILEKKLSFFNNVFAINYTRVAGFPKLGSVFIDQIFRSASLLDYFIFTVNARGVIRATASSGHPSVSRSNVLSIPSHVIAPRVAG